MRQLAGIEGLEAFEERVAHSERLEHASTDLRFRRVTGDLLDHQAQQGVIGVRVTVLLARLVDRRMFRAANVVERFGLAPHMRRLELAAPAFANPARIVFPTGNAAGMSQQLREVARSAFAMPFVTSPPRMSAAVRFRSSRPSCESCMITVVTNTLVMLPTPNRFDVVSGVFALMSA